MTALEKVKRAIDAAIKLDRYRAKELCDKIDSIGALRQLAALERILEKEFGDRTAAYMSARLIRFAFLIEPVNTDVTSTKYSARWSTRLSADDPRRADFDTCVDMLTAACREILDGVSNKMFAAILKFLPDWGISPHELPLDYADKKQEPIHHATNIVVLKDPAYLRLLQLRRVFLGQDSGEYADVFSAIVDKIHVKSYLTDRAQTGAYQTNREKRWEAHPMSPQFALRWDCLIVELALLEQLVGFEGFPEIMLERILAEKVLEESPKPSRCPVTLDSMDFNKLVESVKNPEHGKSPYQVGHLNPLKAGDSPEFRHTAANISWISDDGNRIQGHLALQATKDLITRIAANYQRFDIRRA